MNTASAAGINVIATAYANNQAGLPGGGGAGGTVQYALDSATSSLYRVNPPNDGTLVNRLPLTLEVGDVGDSTSSPDPTGHWRCWTPEACGASMSWISPTGRCSGSGLPVPDWWISPSPFPSP